MKRLILIVIIGFSTIGFVCSSDIVKAENIPLAATASSTYYNSSYYGPDKAVDGDYYSYWIGDMNAAPWWVMFDTGRISKISQINIKWYNHSYYVPTDYDIQISYDGADWQTIYKGISGTVTAEGDTIELNQKTRYIRLYINAIPYYFPVLREFTCTEVSMPHLIRFQGTLGDAEGIPLNGQFTVTFRLYDTDTGGIPLWEETQQNVNIEDGLLDVELGSVASLDLPFDAQYWLGVEVGSDGEMVESSTEVAGLYLCALIQLKCTSAGACT